MEHCSGGDLFSYIEKRGFRLPEPRAAQLIFKISTAVFYLHYYGIAHRDLKPENILMTDNTEEAEIRLLDFGLSKIIGPNETCTEPFGTLVNINNIVLCCT
jgi:serine/threonine protein kinase